MRLLGILTMVCALALAGCANEDEAVDLTLDPSTTTSSTTREVGQDCRLATFPAEREAIASVVASTGDVIDGARMLRVLNASNDPVAVRSPSAAVLETIESQPHNVYDLSARHPCGMVWRVQGLTSLTRDLQAVVPSAGGKPRSPVTLNAGQALGQAAGQWSFGVAVNDANRCPIELLPPTDYDAFNSLLNAEEDNPAC